MATLTRDQILARKVAGHVEPVDIGDGEEVIVRGLSRSEASDITRAQNEGADFERLEIMALALGIVDPPMTEEDIIQWRQQDASGVIDDVSGVIQRLSGTAPGQGKDATKSVPRRRRGRG